MTWRPAGHWPGASDLVLGALRRDAGRTGRARRGAAAQCGDPRTARCAPARPAASLRQPGSGHGARRFLFFGRVQDYKGVADLLAAFAALPAQLAVQLTVAGPCPDRQLQAELRALAGAARHRVRLLLDRVPDGEVTALLAGADVVVLPFRQVTTSGSAILALCHGRPLILPDRPGLAGLPGPAVLRYDGSIPGLAAALARLAVADAETLAAMSAAALGYAAGLAWPDIAERTMAEITAILGPARPGPARRPARAP